jgi:hypothetical protein
MKNLRQFEEFTQKGIWHVVVLRGHNKNINGQNSEPGSDVRAYVYETKKEAERTSARLDVENPHFEQCMEDEALSVYNRPLWMLREDEKESLEDYAIEAATEFGRHNGSWMHDTFEWTYEELTDWTKSLMDSEKAGLDRMKQIFVNGISWAPEEIIQAATKRDRARGAFGRF